MACSVGCTRIYIYIYQERERERERESVCANVPASSCLLGRLDAQQACMGANMWLTSSWLLYLFSHIYICIYICLYRSISTCEGVCAGRTSKQPVILEMEQKRM